MNLIYYIYLVSIYNETTIIFTTHRNWNIFSTTPFSAINVFFWARIFWRFWNLQKIFFSDAKLHKNVNILSCFKDAPQGNVSKSYDERYVLQNLSEKSMSNNKVIAFFNIMQILTKERENCANARHALRFILYSEIFPMHPLCAIKIGIPCII